MGLETLRQAHNDGQAFEPLTEEEILIESQEKQRAEETALKIVLQDVAAAEKYVSTKGLPNEWNVIDELYRAYTVPDVWPGSGKPKSALTMPLVLESIENLLSQIHMAFFSDPQPFLLEANGKTEPKAARGNAKVLCWALKAARAKEEIRKILKSALLYGQCVGKWGWQVAEHHKEVYKRGESGKVTKTLERHEVSRPTLDFVELRNILVDPSLRNHDIRNARYVIHQNFITVAELEGLRDAGYDNVPTVEEMAAIIAYSAEPATDSMTGSKVDSYRNYQAESQTKEFSGNPLNAPLEILEYTTEDTVITVLQRKIVLRNEKNEFGCINYVSCAFIDVLGAWFGFGVGRLIGPEQQLQTGVINRWIDGLDLSLNPMFHRKKGVGAISSNINAAPGKIVNDDGDLQPLNIDPKTPEAMQAIQASEARANRRVGSNFGSEMPNQALRTAEGVGQFTAGVQVKLQYFIENFAELVVIPVFEAFLQQAKDKLQPEQINAILDAEEGKAYEGDVLDVYNAGYSLDVLTSTKLSGRRNMVAMVQQFVQLLASEPVHDAIQAAGKKVDWEEFVESAIDLTGYPAKGWIVDATPEDQQRIAAMNPAVIQAQAKSQQLDQKHGNDMELEESKGTARAGVAVVKHVLDASKESDPAAVAPLANALVGEAQGPVATQPPAAPNVPPPPPTPVR